MREGTSSDILKLIRNYIEIESNKDIRINQISIAVIIPTGSNETHRLIIPSQKYIFCSTEIKIFLKKMAAMT